MKYILSFLFASAPLFAADPPPVLANPDPAITDGAANPCDDFARYACGKWHDETKIPPDKPGWDRSFFAVSEKNQILLRQILESYSAGKFEPPNPYAKQLGELYASCMDEPGLEKGSLATLGTELLRIENAKKEDLPQLLAYLHQRGISALFSFGQGQDFRNPLKVTAQLGQSGMSLPSRDYYLDQTEGSVDLRKKYVNFVVKMFKLTKVDKGQAKADADKILALETRLAANAMAPVDMREPKNLYHPMRVSEVAKLAPDLDFPKYIEALGMPGIERSIVNVHSTKFLKGANDVVRETPWPDLKAYLRYNVLSASARGLPDNYYDEHFDFFGRTLYGVKEKSPRWKRCVIDTENLMGFALGRSFVSLAFAGASKDIAKKLIEDVAKTQKKVIDQVTWMDDSTRRAAHAKLRKLVNQVGYPDKWRNYDGVEITKDSYLANRFNLIHFNFRFELNKIGKPLDRIDWMMPPTAVNAYYDAQMNKMVFPAGILQPPFFHQSYSAAANYAGIGMVMGHEISHGYDDEGRQFDAKGAMEEWWTEKSLDRFNKQTQCLEKQYENFQTAGGGHVNGKLTMGENIGDQGGLKIAYHAWKNSLAKDVVKDEARLRKEEQAFFLAFAQVWCSKVSDAFEKVQVNVNPHPPARYRVTGALMNLPEFAKAYQCKPGARMAPVERCVVW